jgi:hypothetical protein
VLTSWKSLPSMPLTDEEKTLGRWFRDTAQAQLTRLNREQPPDFRPPSFLGLYRHNCEVQPNHRSVAIQLHEVYWRSVDVIPPQDAKDLMGTSVPQAGTVGWDGRSKLFGFIYKEGICKGCKKLARSGAGRLVDVRDRPPTRSVTPEPTR